VHCEEQGWGAALCGVCMELHIDHRFLLRNLMQLIQTDQTVLSQF